MRWTFVNSQEEEIDLVEFENQQATREFVENIGLLRLGPFYVGNEIWNRLLLNIRSQALEPASKHVVILLLGRIKGPRIVIDDFIQLLGSGKNYCDYDIHDIKKVEKEAYKNSLILTGILHACSRTAGTPSSWDQAMWLSVMFELNRPVTYFIMNPETLNLRFYSISASTYAILKEAVKPIEARMKENV